MDGGCYVAAASGEIFKNIKYLPLNENSSRIVAGKGLGGGAGGGRIKIVGPVQISSDQLWGPDDKPIFNSTVKSLRKHYYT